MHDQFFIFTFLTSVTFKTFCPAECALLRKSLTQHFYRPGERESKKTKKNKQTQKTSNTKANPVSRTDSKTRGVFFHSTWPSSHDTQAQIPTVTHTGTHTLKLSWNNCGNVSCFLWLCPQHCLVMHVHTDAVILSLPASLPHVAVGGCRRCAARKQGHCGDHTFLSGASLVRSSALTSRSICLNSLYFYLVEPVGIK